VLTVRVLTTDAASGDLLGGLRGLLDRAFEGRFSADDWEHALGGSHVVVEDTGEIVCHAAVVSRVIEIGGRPFEAGYVEGVATLPGRQREGLGTIAMSRLSDVIRSGFHLGVLSTNTHVFYETLGWERWRGPAFVRRGEHVTRTEDEDGGIMVLRFGPSAGADLSAPITCAARRGDDW
jgi:aminoglycoside 2'-N-acetyltransferase I